MKVKLDENLPSKLAQLLAALGHDTDTVPQEGLAGKPDVDIWAAAQATERFLITQDLDFSNIRHFAPGTHAGLLLVRLRAPGRGALTRRIDPSHSRRVSERACRNLESSLRRGHRPQAPSPPS